MRSFATVVIAAAVVFGACGLGHKEALADDVSVATQRLDAAASVQAGITVEVKPLKRPKTQLNQPPRIMRVPQVAFSALIDLRRDAAAVGVRENDPATAALIFRGSRVFERIPPKTTSTGNPTVPSTSVSNLLALNAVSNPAATPLAGEAVAEGEQTTSTTEKPSALRRQPRIPRVWIAFDYAQLDDEDSGKRAGSYAINPRDILRLLHGTLTGSIEHRTDGQLELYEANVSRDKAERRLPEDRRKLLDKVFRANAVSGRTFPARIWLDRTGHVRRFEVRMRQKLSNIDRADLTVTIDVFGRGPGVEIPHPDPKATATVDSLGQLVTSVTRT